MVEIGFLKDAGAVAFTDCDHVVTRHPRPVALPDLCPRPGRAGRRPSAGSGPVAGAAATSGKFASLRGLPGVSPMAERMGFDRDMALSR
jgi:dihydroorotase